MSRNVLPFYVADVSALARNLRRQLNCLEKSPSHVEVLNLLARAGGYKNFQHLKAEHDVRSIGISPGQPAPEIDFRIVKRLVRFFDAGGRLVRWPGKFSQRILCLWVMWSRLAPRTVYTEHEISSFLNSQHLFGDHALLRRELVDRAMVERTADGRQYRRREVRPPAEALELLKLLRA